MLLSTESAPSVKHVADVLGTSTMGLEIIGELRHDPCLAPFAGIEQTPGLKIMEQTDVVVSAARSGFVEPDRFDLGELLPGTCLINVVIERPPNPHVADTDQLRNLANRHCLAEADEHKVATPEAWQPGDKVIVPPPATAEAAQARMDEGYECTDWYFCKKAI